MPKILRWLLTTHTHKSWPHLPLPSFPVVLPYPGSLWSSHTDLLPIPQTHQPVPTSGPWHTRYPLPGMPSPQLPDCLLLTQRGLAGPPWLKPLSLMLLTLYSRVKTPGLKSTQSQNISCWLFTCLLSVFPAVRQLQDSWDFVSLGLY